MFRLRESQVHLLGVQQHFTCFAELMQNKPFISWSVCSRLPAKTSHLCLSRNPPDLQIPPRGGSLSCLVEEVLLQHDHHAVRALPLRRLPRQPQPLRGPGLLQGVLQPAEMSAPPERHRLLLSQGGSWICVSLFVFSQLCPCSVWTLWTKGSARPPFLAIITTGPPRSARSSPTRAAGAAATILCQGRAAWMCVSEVCEEGKKGGVALTVFVIRLA